MENHFKGKVISNFICPKCEKEILEGLDGRYITGCEHYPIEEPYRPYDSLKGRRLHNPREYPIRYDGINLRIIDEMS